MVNGGDTVRIHFFVAGATEGWHIQITDLTTSHSGTVVLNSKYGPLLPAFSQQKIGKALGWGLVDDTPNSFVWEIGHTSPFTSPAARYCSAYGGPYCIYPWYAYNGADSAFTYGADYLGSQDDYGQAGQFVTVPQCGGPFGPDSTYCDTVLNPGPAAEAR